jgi:hypothetical protein
MVQGVTPAHKGLSPSRLINYIHVVKKMPMLGTHTVYKLWLGLSSLGKSCGFSKASFFLDKSVLKHATAHIPNVVMHSKQTLINF